MKKYSISYTVYYDCIIEIDAENEEQALDKALDMSLAELDKPEYVSVKSLSDTFDII